MKVTANLLKFLCSGLLVITLSAPALAQSDSGIEIVGYDLQLKPNLADRSIEGTARIRIRISTSSSSLVELSIGSLQIDRVSSSNTPLAYQNMDGTLQIELPEQLTEESTIAINYHGTPRFGLKFSEDASEVSTAFSTNQWMPSNVNPSVRAPFKLSLTIPENFQVAAMGTKQSSQRISNGLKIETWEETESMPAYLYGFAAGDFVEFVDDTQIPTLRYLGPPTFSQEELQTIFTNTRHMIEYFEEISGIDYPHNVYTQVLLRNGSGQELDDMAVFSQNYGETVLAEEAAIWLGAHEIAHQWWGNKVTNEAWTHFWLNEGLVSFMTAAYLGHRFGDQYYEASINRSKQQYLRLVSDGHDKPLVFPNWDNPSREDRSIVYDKGTYVIHLLKELVGEESFWSGVRQYTSKYWGKSVASSDFQAALEQASGRNLTKFFEEWVY